MSINPADSAIFGGLYGSARTHELFSDRARLRAMIDVETALARAQARLGIIPRAAAEAITAAARVEDLDLQAIARGTTLAGYPVVAVVKELTRLAGKDAGRYVHWGATTQDILDTALVLQTREALGWVEAGLREVARALAEKALAHRDTPMAGRTHLQHALPITFGFKCALWLDPLIDHLARLAEIRPRALVVQFGGAVGTLASLGEQGRSVRAGLAAELGLGVAPAPWHTSRERLVEIANAMALICGSLAKFAGDVILLMQSEVAEVSEPHETGRGGSSTMPQKRNPIAGEYVLAAARGVHALGPLMLGAMAQDHERATGPWQAEALAYPQILALTDGALSHAKTIAEGMVVDAARMRTNLELGRGLIMAEAAMMGLAPALGRGEAHHVVECAVQQALTKATTLDEALAADPHVAAHLDRAAIARLTDPMRYLGEAGAVVDRVLARMKEQA